MGFWYLPILAAWIHPGGEVLQEAFADRNSSQRPAPKLKAAQRSLASHSYTHPSLLREGNVWNTPHSYRTSFVKWNLQMVPIACEVTRWCLTAMHQRVKKKRWTLLTSMVSLHQPLVPKWRRFNVTLNRMFYICFPVPVSLCALASSQQQHRSVLIKLALIYW